MKSILILVTSLLVSVRGGVDPPNATSLFVPDPNNARLAHAFNVTHLYTRNAFKELGVRLVNKRCQQNREEMYIRYWINLYQLPERLKFVNAFGESQNIYGVNNVAAALEDLIGNKLSWELQLKLKRINRETYYDLMDKLLCSPRNRYRGILPIEIHFRSSPYSQSSFLEFVTNRNVVWELYHDDVYEQHAGNPLDLLYRFRHNFRHALGLGHLDSRESVMFPTNVLGLATINPLDVDAVHYLLCSEIGPIASNVNTVVTMSREATVLKTSRFNKAEEGKARNVYKIENNETSEQLESLFNREKIYIINPSV